MALSILALAPSASADHGDPSDVQVTRLAGPDREGTGRAIAEATFDEAADALIARRDLEFDALAGSVLAGCVAGPVLLAQPEPPVHPDTMAALDELDTETVHLLGREEALSPGVATAFDAAGYDVNRFGGEFREDTAQEISEAAADICDVGEVDGDRTAIIARRDVSADALSGAGVAYAGGFPVLLTASHALAPQADEALDNLEIDHVLILGGEVAISAAAQAQIEAKGISTERLAGFAREDTAIAIADWAVENLGFDRNEIGLARRDIPFDAMTAGPYAGENMTPVLLTFSNSLHPATEAYLEEHADEIEHLVIFGGLLAISAAVEAAAVAAATSGEPPVATFTTAPELINVTRIGTEGSTTVVDYRFDVPVTGKSPVAANFKLYPYANTTTPFAGATATVRPDASDTVRVTFNNVSNADFAAVTLATVAYDAVRGVAGATRDANPEGDFPLGGQQFAAGETVAPDLQTVGNFRPSPLGSSTLVDFTFDQAANNVDATGYRLVRVNPGGDPDITCTFQSGGGTAVHTVSCPLQAGNQVDPATIARGYVETDTVAALPAAGGAQNVLQAAQLRTSNSPDLSSATFEQTATFDRILYRFDEPVLVGATGNFCRYTRGADHICGGASSTQRSTTEDNVVIVTLPAGALNDVVGASVENGAVTRVDTPSVVNRPDEQAVTGTTVAAGRTFAPDLIGCRVETITPGQQYRAVFVFDEAVPTVSATDTLFRVYLADGTQRVGDDANQAPSPALNEVRVTFGAAGSDAALDVNNAVLCGVAHDAVQDGDGNPNPEGSHPRQ